MSDPQGRHTRAGVDWTHLRRRLEAASEALTRGGAPDPEEAKAVLAERARTLARATREDEGAAPLDVLAFELAGERHAVETRHVQAVFRRAALTPLPGIPAPVVGVTVWRGELLVVLRFRSGGAPPVDDPAWVVALGTDRAAFGLLSDTRPELERVERGDLGPAPTASTWGPDAVLGITPDALLVLDGGTLIRTYP